MMFVALTSAYVVRYGLDPDWRSIRMPLVLPFNTAVLLASSLTLELARRALRSPGASTAGALQWLYLTLALGMAFLAGQFVAWRQLSAGGVYLSTNPHASFFYLLTGLHALHLLGGISRWAMSPSYAAGIGLLRWRRAGRARDAYVRRTFTPGARRYGSLLAFHGRAVGVCVCAALRMEVA